MLILMALTEPAAMAATVGEAARLAALATTCGGVAAAAVALACHREAERPGRKR